MNFPSCKMGHWLGPACFRDMVRGQARHTGCAQGIEAWHPLPGSSIQMFLFTDGKTEARKDKCRVSGSLDCRVQNQGLGDDPGSGSPFYTQE